MKYKTKDLIMAAILIVIGIVLPMAFHFFGINGTIFSPMHIPVLFSGLVLGPSLGLIVGILTPILSYLITNIPTMPFLWVMTIELGLYGFISGVFYKKLGIKLMPSLIFSMILGRVGGALSIMLFTLVFELNLPSPLTFIKRTTITAIPGIIIQFLLIPALTKFYNNKNRSIISQ